jgi:hypothetical protein
MFVVLASICLATIAGDVVYPARPIKRCIQVSLANGPVLSFQSIAHV